MESMQEMKKRRRSLKACFIFLISELLKWKLLIFYIDFYYFLFLLLLICQQRKQLIKQSTRRGKGGEKGEGMITNKANSSQIKSNKSKIMRKKEEKPKIN